LKQVLVAVTQGKNVTAFIAVKGAYLRIDDEELALVGCMQTDMIGYCRVETMQGVALFA